MLYNCQNLVSLSSVEAEKSYRTGGWWLAGWVLNLEKLKLNLEPINRFVTKVRYLSEYFEYKLFQ